MRISTLIVSALSLVLCLAAAGSVLVRVPVISIASIGQELARRQVSIGSPSPLPSQCTTTCSPVNNEVSLGCPVTACCTTTFETQYYNCLECVGMALNIANYSTAQNSLNLLYTTCVDIGFVLPRLELPGQGNSSGNATGSVSTTALFPTNSTTTTSSTGAAVTNGWQSMWFGAAVLLGLVGLW